MSRTWNRKQGLIAGCIVASIHLLFLLYLHFAYHSYYEGTETLFPLSVTLNSNFAPAVKQAMSQRPAAVPHREPIFSYILFQFRIQTPTVTVRVAHCGILDSISDGNQQNKTRWENLFYHRDIITIAKLKTCAPCETDKKNPCWAVFSVIFKMADTTNTCVLPTGLVSCTDFWCPRARHKAFCYVTYRIVTTVSRFLSYRGKRYRCRPIHSSNSHFYAPIQHHSHLSNCLKSNFLRKFSILYYHCSQVLLFSSDCSRTSPVAAFQRDNDPSSGYSGFHSGTHWNRCGRNCDWQLHKGNQNCKKHQWQWVVSPRLSFWWDWNHVQW